MTRVVWDTFDYDTGIDRGVFYPKNSPGEVWNGIVSVEDTPEEFPTKSRYLDGFKYGQDKKEAPYSAVVSTYTNPTSWYDTIAQMRKNNFGFTYRTGNDIHIVYNCRAQPSELAYLHEEPGLYKWNLTTTPVALPEGGFSSHLIIEGSIAYPETVASLEDTLYGTDTSDPVLPTPEEVLAIFEDHAILRVYDNGDGTFTVIGPDSAITMLDANTFEITWPSAVFLNISETRYRIRSL